MLHISIRGKGNVPCDLTQLSFCEGVKLTNTDGWKINIQYNDNKSYSLSIPKFDTDRVAVKGQRYLIRTRYSRVLKAINQLAKPVAHYVYENREKLGITKSEEEIENMLIKDIFVARTLHSNVFIDSSTNKAIELESIKSRFRVRCYVKPVIYIQGEKVYIDLEIVRSLISTDLSDNNRQNKDSEKKDEIIVTEKKLKGKKKKKSVTAVLPA